MDPKVLLIVHQAQSNPGRISRILQEIGYEPVICRHACGEELPTSPDDFAGTIIFGGPMSANDDTLPFIRSELQWIDSVLLNDRPFLGICLGAQLLARHLGSKIHPHDSGLHEIGYYKVSSTPAGSHIFNEEQHFYQWHSEGYTLPECAVLLAEGDFFKNQAFQYNKAFGIQFHPDVTRDMMLSWTRKTVHRMVLPGAQARESHLIGQVMYDEGVERWSKRFFRHWLNQTEDFDFSLI